MDDVLKQVGWYAPAMIGSDQRFVWDLSVEDAATGPRPDMDKAVPVYIRRDRVVLRVFKTDLGGTYICSENEAREQGWID